MATKRRPLSDEAIATKLDAGIRTAVGFESSTLSRERSDVLKFYKGEEPKPAYRGTSQYISQEVFDSVESMRSALLEVFCGNRRPVRFAATTEQDAEAARIATEYCTYVVYRANPGYQVFSDVIFDGLTARAGVAKVWWEAETRWDTMNLEAPDEVTAMMSLDTIEEDYEIDDVTYNDDGSVSGTLRVLNRSGRVRITSIPPEEFGISPRARTIQEAPVVYHRTRKTRSDLIKAGYDKKTIEELANNQDYWTEEYQERHKDTDDGTVYYEEQMQDASRWIMVYECYAQLDVSGTGTTSLWKVTLAGGKVLDKEQVKRAPFVAFVPLPLSHTFHGSNYAAKVIPTQKTRTALTRSIVDHAMITNNPRMTVLRGGVVNPKELMENRIGGIVNLTRPDALGQVPQVSLNPFVFQTIQLLDADKEQTTGISKLSQGLNKDAISKQNSADMMQQMVSISQQRQKIIARNFAEQFVKELFLLVHQIALENDTQTTMLEVSGNFVEVDPSKWESRTMVDVEFALGYGEQDKEVQKYVSLHQFLGGDPRFATMYTPEHMYNTARRILEAGGVMDVSTFIKPFEPPPPPQPDPLEVKKLEIQERQVAVQEAQLQFQMEKSQREMLLKTQELGAKGELEERKVNIKEDEVRGKLRIAEKEVDMLNSMPDGENKRGIVSP